MATKAAAAVSILELADNLDSLTIDPAAMEVPVDFIGNKSNGLIF